MLKFRERVSLLLNVIWDQD